MDTFNQNQMPTMTSPAGPVETKKSYGALIAVIVILLLIVVGGMYFLGQRMNRDYTLPTTSSNGDEVTGSLEQQSSSDDLNSIESDLNANNFNNLDQGAAAIEAELRAQ